MIDTNPSDKAITEMALLFSGIERGAEDERAAIVAFLIREALRGHSEGAKWLLDAADAIESEAHLAKRGEDA